MNLLNLDEFATVKRSVQLGGKQYEIAEQTLGSMIDQVKEAKSRKRKVTEEDIANEMLGQAQKVLPTAPLEVLRGLNTRQLKALVEFATATDEEAVAGATRDDEGNEKAAD